MGNQTFMYTLLNGERRLAITKRLYNEIIADTNGKDFGQAEYLIKKKLRECPREVMDDNSNRKPAIEI
jgi:hypothetical protein